MSRVYRALWASLAIVVVSVGIAMSSTRAAPAPLYPGGAGDYGYTISLILFVLPVGALLWWFSTHRARIDRHWSAFWWTFLIIVGLWSVLDILLARTFFRFPNPDATLGINVIGFEPGVGWGPVVPIEEFAFYILGCAFLVLTYIWASELWFPEHTKDDTEYDAATARIRVEGLLHWPSLGWGVGVIVLAVAYKAIDPFGAVVPGFPGYLTFMVLLVIVPTAMFFHTVLKFVNVRALVFTLQSMLLIAVLWEATLALPYGWWDYEHARMLGVFVQPWSNLPVEAVLLWGAAAWSNIAIYEVMKLLIHRRKAAQAT